MLRRPTTAISGFGFLLLAAACATVPAPGPATPLVEGLGRYGRVAASPLQGGVVVVVIKDRHTTHGAVTRSRDALAQVRKENRAALGFLVQKDFAVLGCEAALGPLPSDRPAAAHRAAVREALAEGDDLDALTVYQPIRYDEEFAGRLTVLGVEDPELYDRDTRLLDEIVQLRGVARRNDVDVKTRTSAAQEVRHLIGQISAQAKERGRRAAENLLAALAERGLQRGILMLGGAHAQAAVDALAEKGVTTVLFECRSYGAPVSPSNRSARTRTDRDS